VAFLNKIWFWDNHKIINKTHWARICKTYPIKMKNILPVFLFMLMAAFGCQPEKASKSDRRIEEINAVPNAAEMIRNPISAKGLQDTTNLPKMVFVETKYDFATVEEGDKVSHTFKFTNAGKVSLLISDVRSTCGCTVPKWPKEAIPPGEQNQISVVFDTAGKKERQHKLITITANTYPSKTVLSLDGFVTPK